MSALRRPSVLLVTPGPEHPGFGAPLRLPLSSLSLMAWESARGMPAEELGLWDMRIDPAPPLDLGGVRVAGISAMTGRQIKYGLQAASQIRRHAPSATIVWGGIHASLLPEQTAAHPLVDIVAVGEGEETFSEIIDRVRSGKALEEIAGTCIVRKGETLRMPARPFVDPDRLPLPVYEAVELNRYYNVRSRFDYQSSRGCPFRCDFCYNTAFCGGKWRGKSAEKVADELTVLRDRFGAEVVAFVDDEFFIDKKRVERIVALMAQAGGGLRYSASCRLDIVRRFSDELLVKLRETGFQYLYFGAESGCDTMLSVVHKGITTEDIVAGAVKTARSGIRPVLSFVSGFPGETKASFSRTVEMLQRLRAVDSRITVNGVFPFSPYPGTALFGTACDLGMEPPGTLEGWGEWLFQYTPTNPWLNRSMRREMQTLFFMVRFQYYLDMYRDRYGHSLRVLLVGILSSPLQCSARLRMRWKLFRFAPEWRLFGYLAGRTMGYL